MVRRYIALGVYDGDGTNEDMYVCDLCLPAIAEDGRIWRGGDGNGEIIPRGFKCDGDEYDHLEDCDDGTECEPAINCEHYGTF